MRKITLTKMDIQNFKGVNDLSISFDDTTNIYGANGTGKTTIMDAFTWLLFDKDSTGSSKFDVRPLTTDGTTVGSIEIKVSADMTVDDEQITLTKVQKQKWVKKRGSETATFQGNENSFEISGFPVSLSEFQAKVNSIISEDLFKLITNPKAFPTMKWQDQRRILMGMVDDVTDEMVLDESEEYAPIRADVLAAGADKALDKARKAMAKLKDAQKALPIRIDEASKSIVDVPDEKEVVQKRNALMDEVKSLDDEANALGDAYKEAADVKSQITKAKYDLMDIDTAALREAQLAYETVKTRYEHLQKYADEIFNGKRELKVRLDHKKVRLHSLETEMEGIKEEYLSAKAETLPDGSLTCPTCGQAFPEDKAAEITASFAEKKKKRIAEIKKHGDVVYAMIKAHKEEIQGLNSQIEKTQEAWNTAAAKASQAYEAMNNTPQTVKAETLPEHIEKQKEIDALQAKLASMDDGSDMRRVYSAKKAELNGRLAAVNTTIARIQMNEQARERVAELTEELKQTSQQVADQERIVYLLEQFNRAKMDALSLKINDHFKVVRFKLFEQQINGAIKDTCEMTINGVPYASLNSASKVQGGLDVINALSEYYQVSAPIFIDNRESTSQIPEMNAQVINLYVSEADKQLRIVT